MIISLSGLPGAGKSTVAKRLAKKLGYRQYYMGRLRREAAKKRGMSLEAYNKLGETDSSTDLDVDKYQERLGKTEDDFVIEGRTSFHFIPHSFKVFLDVDMEEGARRIMGDEDACTRNEEVAGSVKEQVTNLQERMASDHKRYQKYFGIDCYDKSNYDFVLDTTHLAPAQIVEKIIKAAKQHGNI
ncbi:cytidylate kinase family protein [Candidatus Woesearchaeota archaeon]|nr:cytidylate kinase family protein [Candidatus Woesearchaeota archaeon]